MDSLDFELESTQYWPDVHLPVDRWLQAENASNARTTSAVLDLLHGDEADVVLDPFAGGGSSAMAARLQQRSFYGIERDPLLATISLAKAESRPEHVELLPDTRGARHRTWLPEALAAIHARPGQDEALVVSALAIVVALGAARGEPLDADTLRADLIAVPTRALPGRVVCGDSTSPETWKLLRLPGCGVLAYTSPPFGPTSPTLAAPQTIRDQASRLLAGHGRLHRSGSGRADPQYADITMAMLHCLVRHAVRGQVVLEHEPDDNKSDSTDIVLARIATELPSVLHAPRRNRYGEFSKRGRFTLLTHRILSHRVDGS